jgi:hypothetical protein
VAGEVALGSRAPKAQIPFLVEAWARAEGDADETSFTACVNRTPVTGEVRISPNERKMAVFGCGLHHRLDVPKGNWSVVLNVTTPYMPITTDGKEPNLELIADKIVSAIEGAVKRAKRAAPKRERGSVKDTVIDNIVDVVDRVSSGGQYRVSQRQLFYAMRPVVVRVLGCELKWENFQNIVTDYEDEHGEIGPLYRDNRGVMYEPHAGKGDVPVGTLMAEGYERPLWMFNKIVYIEKQALFESLKANHWPELHDCALITSKGMTTRAVKDIIDGLAKHSEPIKVFCVHDADSAGTMIYQTLQNETRARGARAIEIINLGLEPWEAREMGLESEAFEKKEKRRPVANYVTERPDGDHWNKWLQSNRYELDAMSTPQFLEWITAKIEAHDDVGKVIPPAEFIAETADGCLRTALRNRIEERILREANVDVLVEDELAAIGRLDLTPEGAQEWLSENNDRLWLHYVEGAVEDVVGD